MPNIMKIHTQILELYAVGMDLWTFLINYANYLLICIISITLCKSSLILSTYQKSWWSVNTFLSYSRPKFERKSVPAVPKKPLGGPNSQHLLSVPRAIYHSKIMTTACPEHEVYNLKVLLQYLRQPLEGPLSNLTFVFLTPTHLPNIIRIHSRVLELSCIQTNALTYKSRYSTVGKS